MAWTGKSVGTDPTNANYVLAALSPTGPFFLRLNDLSTIFARAQEAPIHDDRIGMSVTMTDDQIYKKLAPIFRDVFDDDSIVPVAAMTAADVVGWDSLANIRMIVAVEGALGIRFSTAEITSHQNVGDFVASIHAKL